MNRWIKLPTKDGYIHRLPGIGIAQYVTPAQFAAFPDRLRNVPTDPQGYRAWHRTHYAELAARLLGGTHAEPYALRLANAGAPLAEAITRARAAVPAGKPAEFPRIVQALMQAGNVPAAQWVKYGRTAATATAAAASASSTPTRTEQAPRVSPAAAGGLLLALALL